MKRGRKKLNDKARTERVMVRMTKTDVDKIKKYMLEENYKTISNFIREVVLTYINYKKEVK